MNHVFVQARLSSTRLPGKIMKKILNKTIIELVIERLYKVENIDKVVVVTGTKEKNLELINEIKRLGLDYFCGNEENVLDRFYKASNEFSPDNIIRVTADCPLIDFNIISRALETFAKSEYDILSNNRIKSYPHGFEFEIFKKEALHRAWNELSKKYAKNEFEQIFVNPTQYMLQTQGFKNYDLVHTQNLSHLRLTLDYPEDLKLITLIYELLYHVNRYFTLNDILVLIQNNPSLLNINKRYADNN